MCVLDNGPQLVSDEFESFLRRNSIKHITVAYCKAQSNGQAEAVVKSFKYAMKKMLSGDKDLEHCLNSWLLLYRNTPHASTGTSPAVLMFGRRTRTVLSLVNPLSSKASKVQKDSLKKEQEVVDSKERVFEPGDKVLCRDERKKQWKEGTLLQQ